jgi:branched-chain amino acid transport system permease protein
LLGEGAKLVTGDVPGLDLILYGAVLVLVIWFSPRGLIGGCAQMHGWFTRRSTPAIPSIKEAGHG